MARDMLLIGILSTLVFIGLEVAQIERLLRGFLGALGFALQ